MNQEFTSKNTCVNSARIPALFHRVDWVAGTKNLDYGGGKYNNVTEFLSELGVDNYVYDPYNRNCADNKEALAAGPFDTITLSNVLNVIKEKRIRYYIVRKCLSLLKDGGKIYISVYEGDKSKVGRQTKEDCWQNNQPIDFYFNEIKSISHCVVKNRQSILLTKHE